MPVIDLSPNCLKADRAQVVFIGFPLTNLRLEESQAVPIEDKTYMMKRWSTGLLTGDYYQDGMAFVGTTADAISGNSGGPALDENGKLIGVVALSKKAGQQYQGSEASTMIWQSAIVGCFVTKDFLLKSWEQFQKELNSKI